MEPVFHLDARGPTVVVVLHAPLDRANAEALFAELDRRSQGEMRGLVYDVRAVSSVDPRLIGLARDSASRLHAVGVKIAVVTQRAPIRFALSTVQLAVKDRVGSFATLEEALAYVAAPALARGSRRSIAK